MANPFPPSVASPAPNMASINLTRMLSRFHQILVTPDSATEARLRVSESERAKVEANLEYARKLLAQLEQEAPAPATLSEKLEAQADFFRKRQTLQNLAQRLQLLNELAVDEDGSSGEEDLLGRYPSAEVASIDVKQDSTYASPEKSPQEVAPSLAVSETPIEVVPSTSIPPNTPESTLRARHQADKEELLHSSARSTGVSLNATAESLLSHNRTEQENLTNALLQMATNLKSSSQAFNVALSEEKNVLDSATHGLEKNELGLVAAQKRMGLLRIMTEGKGWWGRMLMYAWIAGLAMLAILIVFVMPKLRF